MAVEIRQATEHDIEWIIVELQAFSKFFDSKYPLLGDEQLVRGMLDACRRDHYLRVADRVGNGDAVHLGFLAGTVTGHPFNPQIKTLTELLWWVKPEHRGSRAGLMLFDDFVQFGKDIAANWIIFGLETISPVSDEFMIRKGFKHKERNFLMEL
jgi:hypothetical protein